MTAGYFHLWRRFHVKHRFFLYVQYNALRFSWKYMLYLISDNKYQLIPAATPTQFFAKSFIITSYDMTQLLLSSAYIWCCSK